MHTGFENNALMSQIWISYSGLIRVFDNGADPTDTFQVFVSVSTYRATFLQPVYMGNIWYYVMLSGLYDMLQTCNKR